MTILQLQYFLAICEYGSMSKAARKLHVSEPSVSVSIKQLEDELSVDLFYRVNKKLVITEDGAELENLAKIIVKQAAHIEDHFKEKKNEIKHVRIGMSYIFSMALIDVMHDFSVQNPDISLETFSFGREEVSKLLTGEIVDMIIVGSSDYDDLSAFNTRRIGESTVHFYTSRKNELSRYKTIRPEMIRKEPLIVFTEVSDHHASIEDLKHSIPGFEPENILSYTNQLQTVRNMVAQNIGSAIIIDKALPADDKIVRLPIDGAGTFPITAVWKKERYLSSADIRLLNVLENALQSPSLY
jgi:DNA-binding transcriptional LysR family regulator